LRLDPCLPSDWDHVTIVYTYRSTPYTIELHNPQGVHRGVVAVSVDGAPVPDGVIQLRDDQRAHTVVVELGLAAIAAEKVEEQIVESR
jgi:cellobiose phosphorylase